MGGEEVVEGEGRLLHRKKGTHGIEYRIPPPTYYVSLWPLPYHTHYIQYLMNIPRIFIL